MMTSISTLCGIAALSLCMAGSANAGEGFLGGLLGGLTGPNGLIGSNVSDPDDNPDVQREVDYLGREAKAESDYLNRDAQSEIDYMNRDSQPASSNASRDNR